MMKYVVCACLLTLAIAMPGAQDDRLAYCVNHGGFKDFPMEEPHICACDRGCSPDQPEDTKCKVYCRKDHCHCIAECEKAPPQ